MKVRPSARGTWQWTPPRSTGPNTGRARPAWYGASPGRRGLSARSGTATPLSWIRRAGSRETAGLDLARRVLQGATGGLAHACDELVDRIPGACERLRSELRLLA